MSELLQDVTFLEDDDHPTLILKLRMLQEAVITLGQQFESAPAVHEGQLNLGQVDLAASAGAAAGVISISVNGVPYAIQVLTP